MKNHNLLILSTFAAFGNSQNVAAKPNQNKPNIIVFLIDDFGWKDLGCYGGTYYQTPNVDLLAKEGIRFTNAYSACAVSSPTRAALQTGKYPAKLHLTDWIPGNNPKFAKLKRPDWKMYLPLSEKTAAESLKEAGYATWHVGKWHLGEKQELWAQYQGFDINIGGGAVGSPQKHDDCNGYFSPYCLPNLENGPVGEYLTDRLTDEAIKLIDSQKDKPFYLNFCHYAVHGPLMGKADKIAKYKAMQDPSGMHKNAVYAAVVESMDESIGRIYQKLKAKNLLENTLIIFASDNGAVDYVSSSMPLKHGKGWAYEGGIRTPLLLSWKNKIKANTTSDEPVITMDIYSTILDVAGISQAKDVDGKTLMPVIQNNKKYNRPLFWHYPHYHNDNPHGSVRFGDWKLIQYFEDMHYELYNLKTDLGETNNLAASNPEKLKELEKLMLNWRKKVDAQMPTLNPKYDATKNKPNE